MPMRVCFRPPPEGRRPKSATASFARTWTKAIDGSVVEYTVERWRRGMR